MNANTLAVTYTQHNGRWFMVSTINRESSAIIDPALVYAETIVWEWDEKTRERGAMLWQGEDCRGFLATHNAAVSRIRETGSPAEEAQP